VAEIAHQAKGHLLQAVRRETFEKALNQSFFNRLFDFWGEEFRQSHLEGSSDSLEEHDRNVAFADFELREMAFGDIRFSRCGAASESTPVAEFAHALAKSEQKLIFAGRCGAVR
jgi:hypothetical protein